MTRQELMTNQAAIKSVLDYPYWASVTPTNAGTATFFLAGGAISAANGIDTQGQLDKTALFVM